VDPGELVTATDEGPIVTVARWSIAQIQQVRAVATVRTIAVVAPFAPRGPNASVARAVTPGAEVGAAARSGWEGGPFGATSVGDGHPG